MDSPLAAVAFAQTALHRAVCSALHAVGTHRFPPPSPRVTMASITQRYVIECVASPSRPRAQPARLAVNIVAPTRRFAKPRPPPHHRAALPSHAHPLRRAGTFPPRSSRCASAATACSSPRAATTALSGCVLTGTAEELDTSFCACGAHTPQCARQHDLCFAF